MYAKIQRKSAFLMKCTKILSAYEYNSHEHDFMYNKINVLTVKLILSLNINVQLYMHVIKRQII